MAPLLALGRPLAVVAAGLPREPRLGRVGGTPRAGLACAVDGVALWLWHLPPLYDAALARARDVDSSRALLTAIALALLGDWLRTGDRRSSAVRVGGSPNAPEHLVRWLQHPRRVRPGTPMPEMGVTERDARDIAAFLYTLR